MSASKSRAAAAAADGAAPTKRAAATNAPSLQAFSVHPGVVDTPMLKQLKPATIAEWCALQTKPCPLSAAEGASTQAYLAVAPDASLAGTGGDYFVQCQPARPAKYDADEQTRLFDQSLVWSGATGAGVAAADVVEA